MRRMRIDMRSVSVCRLLRDGTPLSQRSKDIASRFDRNVKACTYGTRTLTPREKDCGWVVDDSLFQFTNAGFDCVIVGRIADAIECLVDLGVVEVSPVATPVVL